MWVVKHDLLHNWKDSQLHQGPVEGGQLRPAGVPSKAHQAVYNNHHGPRDEHLVEDDGLHCMAKLCWIHLHDRTGIREHNISMCNILQTSSQPNHWGQLKPYFLKSIWSPSFKQVLRLRISSFIFIFYPVFRWFLLTVSFFYFMWMIHIHSYSL